MIYTICWNKPKEKMPKKLKNMVDCTDTVIVARKGIKRTSLAFFEQGRWIDSTDDETEIKNVELWVYQPTNPNF